MKKHLPIMPHKQRPSYCGPACLKMLFAHHGIHASEKKIGSIAGTTFERGTSLAGMKQAAEHFGFIFKHKDLSSFADIKRLLEQGIAPIVDWFLESEGHYSVVVGLDEKNIYLQDPYIGKKRRIDRTTFYRVWFDFPGDYIKDPSTMYLRRMMYLKKK
ncbi:C39 family peptidase [Candidatus Uhrbacteria bacterium]|nr:C39 family peptidase [Candidatus Uhrbacteria bacterium]